MTLCHRLVVSRSSSPAAVGLVMAALAAVSPKPVVIHTVRHRDLAHRCPQRLYHLVT